MKYSADQGEEHEGFTVGQLIAELSKYDSTTPVLRYDAERGELENIVYVLYYGPEVKFDYDEGPFIALHGDVLW